MLDDILPTGAGGGARGQVHAEACHSSWLRAHCQVCSICTHVCGTLHWVQLAESQLLGVQYSARTLSEGQDGRGKGCVPINHPVLPIPYSKQYRR